MILGPPERLERTPRAEVETLIADEIPKGGAPREVARRVRARADGWTTGEIYSMLPRMGRPSRD